MELNSLSAISPVDGRYREKVSKLSTWFSEFALIRYRIQVEIEYFIALSKLLDELPDLDKSSIKSLRFIYQDFTMEDAEHVKHIEAGINHDVKAIEYFLQERFKKLGLGERIDFIHFALTSQDINNTAVPLAIKDFQHEFYLPNLSVLTKSIIRLAEAWKNQPMLAHTHGQPATPTAVGKELRVFTERIQGQLTLLKQIPIEAKFGGATGNFNAHYAAYPDINWSSFANAFIEQLGLKRQQNTTQIEHYDQLAARMQNMARINTILIDLCRDCWTYISMDYFRQIPKEAEVGSSTMPHKINPIDFENAEGNFGFANAIFNHLAEKLPLSRMQRDLTDSTVSRNIGVPMAHTIIGFASLQNGLSKLELNVDKLNAELEANWAVVSEGIQTILRKVGYPTPYEVLKTLTRGKNGINQETMLEFIETLDVEEGIKQQLRNLTPFNYIGNAKE